MKLNFKRRLISYKNIPGAHKLKRILFVALLAIITLFLILTTSACCIDYSKILTPGSDKFTFEGNEEDAARLGELLEKYDINPEDLASSNDNQYTEIDYTEIKKELSDASDYQVAPEEEEVFFGCLEKIYTEEKFIQARDYLRHFKSLYPSGYFTLVKVTQKQDYNAGYGWFELLDNNGSHNPEELEGFEDFDFSMLAKDFNEEYTGDLIVIVHELTHCGSGLSIHVFVKDLNDYPPDTYYSYMIGNLLIFVEKDKMYFSKYELLQDIESPDDFDRTYLDINEVCNITGAEDAEVMKIDFTMILDELNAYTVSVKCAIACEEFIKHSSSERRGLLKQMSHLELYLKRCYEKYPGDWDSIAENKGLAFVIMKLWLEAEKYENAVKDDTRFNMDSEPVSEFVYHPDNYGIIEKFFADSGILSWKDKNFKEAGEELTEIKVYDINS